MGSNRELFERYFGSNENDGEITLNREERLIAEATYALASRIIQDDFGGEPDDDPDAVPSDDDDEQSVESFDEPIQAAMENFQRVIELFKLSNKAKKAFLENFDHWSSLRKNNIQHLTKIAEKIQEHKFNCDIAKVVGSSVGIIGGILAGLSLIPILAPVTIPLAITAGVSTVAGGGTVVGSTITEIVLMKSNLEEAKTIAEKDRESFSTMEKWFIHTQDLKNALENLITLDLLEEMSEDLKKFNAEVDKTLGSLKDEFRHLLTECIGKMFKRSKIVEMFGVVLAPVVMTFVLVVCLVRDHNRMILECIINVERFTFGLLSLVGIGAQAGRLGVNLATKGAVAAVRTSAVIATSVFVAIGVVFDVVNVVWSSIDIHNRPLPEHATTILEAVSKLEEEFSFIESVYEELKNWQSIDRPDVNEWKSILINHVPNDAKPIDIKMVVKLYLSEEAWSCIRLLNCSMDGNSKWLVIIPASHSELLLKQSQLTIKTVSCQVTEWTFQWKTFIVLHIPTDAEEEDIKMGVRPHLPQNAWNSIKLQKLSSNGNNWLVKVKNFYTQNLEQQSHLIVKGDRCLVTQ